MLKTNSKQARANIRAYILEHYDPSGYEELNREPETFGEAANVILITAAAEKFYSGAFNYDTFRDWCQGLPSILDTCYYYNRSARDDVGRILEQTEEEKSKSTESDAEELLTKLIYRELVKGGTK